MFTIFDDISLSCILFYFSELTIILSTARDKTSQTDAMFQLTTAHVQTNSTVSDLLTAWPGVEADGFMFKTKVHFLAVLQSQRELLQRGANLQDQLTFYTDVIHVLCHWFVRHSRQWSETSLFPYLATYGYLLHSINYLGGQQALCSAYYSVICFSHKQTFLFANYSFSGEAFYKEYASNYAALLNGAASQPSKQYDTVFPNLAECHRELVSDINYPGMAMDTSSCDFSRRNETRFRDLDLLVSDENEHLAALITSQLTEQQHSVTQSYVLALSLCAGVLTYFILIHLVRCVYIKGKQLRHKSSWLQDEKLDDETMTMTHVKLSDHPSIIEYNDLRRNEDSLAPYVKVASV